MHAIYDANYNLIGYGSDGAGDVQDFFKDNSGNFNQNIDYFVNYIVNYEAVHFNIEPITVTAKKPAVIAVCNS